MLIMCRQPNRTNIKEPWHIFSVQYSGFINPAWSGVLLGLQLMGQVDAQLEKGGLEQICRSNAKVVFA